MLNRNKNGRASEGSEKDAKSTSPEKNDFVSKGYDAPPKSYPKNDKEKRQK